MNKDRSEALARLAQLETEAKLLREILEPSILPNDRAGTWRIDGSNFTFTPSHNNVGAPIGNNNYFPDRNTARAYCDAFGVALALRRQPGSDVSPFGSAWLICMTDEGEIAVTLYHSRSPKASITPCFKTNGLAEAAIEAVGRDRIIAAIKLFSNFK